MVLVVVHLAARDFLTLGVALAPGAATRSGWWGGGWSTGAHFQTPLPRWQRSAGSRTPVISRAGSGGNSGNRRCNFAAQLPRQHTKRALERAALRPRRPLP